MPGQSHFDLWLVGPALPATDIPAKVADAPLARRYPVPEAGCFATVVFILRPLDSGFRRSDESVKAKCDCPAPNAAGLTLPVD